MADVLVALDQGTTSTRAMVFQVDGTVLGRFGREHQQHYPQPGWVEHDALELWANTQAVLREACQHAAAAGHTPIALGLTNQRETIVAWDKSTGAVLAPALVWQDKRTAAACAALQQDDALRQQVKALTGLPLDPYFSASKMQWLLNHVPAVQAAAASGTLAFGTIDSFLVWQLTGGQRHVTDITNASRTLLCNIHTGQWNQTLLDIFDIPAASLPQILPNVADFGTVLADGLVDGLAAPLPITGMAGDQHAAMVGQLCLTPGTIKITYGTGCFALLNTGEPAVSDHGLLTTVAFQLGENAPRMYALEGSIFVAGAAVQWLRDKLKMITSAAETEQLAAQAGEDDVYLVPAFAGLGAPYWDPDARGTLVGMTLGTDRAVLARAVLDSVAYQTADLLEAMWADTKAVDKKAAPPVLKIDGGMVANDWFCQRLADTLALPVTRPQVTETTAFGAALLAGLGAGCYADPAALAAHWQAAATFTPQLDDVTRQQRLAGWHQAVAAAR